MKSRKLTRRQAQFLQEIRELQRENQGDPIHYSAVAERLDVSNSTSYTMLKILEEKGCIISRYHLPERRIGRSSLLFEAI